MDSASFAEKLADAWYAGAGRTVARIPYDSVGDRGAVSVIGLNVMEPAGDRLQGVIEEYASAEGEPGSTVDLFLGDGGGPRPRRVRALRTCPPSLANSEHLSDLIRTEARALGLATRALVRLYVRVLADGSTGEVRIDEPSANAPVNAAAVRIVGEARFEPARVAGIPVATWASFPVTILPARPSS